MSARSLLRFSVMLFGLVCTAVQATPPSWEAQRADIQRVIDEALDVRQAAIAAGETPPPTSIDPGAISGWADADLASLAQLIDERAALRGPVVTAVELDTSTKQTREKQGRLVEDALRACYDEDETPVIDARAESFEPGFDVVEACKDTRLGEGRAISSLEALNPGPNDAVAAPSEWNFQLLTEKDSSRVSLKMDFSDTTVDFDHDGVVQSSGLVLSAPVNKDDEQGTDLIGLGGLGNDFQAEYTYSRIYTPILGEGAKNGPAFFDMPRACQYLGMTMEDCDYANILRVADEKRGTVNTSPRPDGEVRWTPEAILTRFATNATARVLGYRIGAGYDKFSFFDPNDLSKRKMDEVPWGVGAHYGWLTTDRFLAIGFDYQRDYEAATKVTACLDEVEGPVVECVTGSLGGPASEWQHLLWTEGRWLIRGTGVSAKVTHDLKSGGWEVGVPIYFLHNADGFLSGGVRFGWNNDDKFSAGIFVGVPFQFRD